MAATRVRSIGFLSPACRAPGPALCPATRLRRVPGCPGVGGRSAPQDSLGVSGGRRARPPTRPAGDSHVTPGPPRSRGAQFRLMAVLHHVCQPPLPPRPLPPPFAEEKRPLRSGARNRKQARPASTLSASNMAAPRPRPRSGGVGGGAFRRLRLLGAEPRPPGRGPGPVGPVGPVGPGGPDGPDGPAVSPRSAVATKEPHALGHTDRTVVSGDPPHPLRLSR